MSNSVQRRKDKTKNDFWITRDAKGYVGFWHHEPPYYKDGEWHSGYYCSWIQWLGLRPKLTFKIKRGQIKKVTQVFIASGT